MRACLLLPLALFACSDEATTPEQEPPPASLDELVTIDALLGHLDALQALADAQGGTRVQLSDGYSDSVVYAQGVLEQAGYAVTLEPFEIVAFDVLGGALEQTAPTPTDYDGTFTVFSYSGAGDVTAPVAGVDLLLPPGAVENSSTSGCEAEDFDAFPAGSIALMQRGSCTFATKVGHAFDAGAVAAVVFNEGQPGRTEPVEGTLDADAPAPFPVVGIGSELGGELAALAEAGGLELRVMTDVLLDVQTDHNVIAQTPWGDTDRVVLVGAHLDSVAAGPGINDNGSGTALVLEAATQLMERAPTRNAVRFALWGAEESGLVGSYHHAFDGDVPDPATTGDVEAYLNYDMIASGNGYRIVYDGDGSDVDDGGASAGSALVEAVHTDWFDGLGMGHSADGMFIPSDSYWFVLAGIPTGGLFSGAMEPKTKSQADDVGGVRGDPLDPCYHQVCDTRDNIDEQLFDELGTAAAHAIEALAEREEPLPRAGRSALRDVPRPRGCHEHVQWDR